MKMASSNFGSVFLLLSLFVAFIPNALCGNFYQDFQTLFGGHRVNITDGGNKMSLSMDRHSGSGMVSKKEYLFGRFDMQMKLVPGNSAGTVTAFYLSSRGKYHDEIDVEFLGNLSGDPYLLSTNIFANGIGDREMQFYLWFDPTADFHNYSIDWNSQRVIFLVDNVPVRVMLNREDVGVSFPTTQPMRVYTTIWNGDSWATRWGQIKLDLSCAPFIANFKNFNAHACVAKFGGRSCKGFNGGKIRGIDAQAAAMLKEIQSNWMVYDYCRDLRRYAHDGLPYECRKENHLKYL